MLLVVRILKVICLVANFIEESYELGLYKNSNMFWDIWNIDGSFYCGKVGSSTCTRKQPTPSRVNPNLIINLI